jgi:hypothetical protein
MHKRVSTTTAPYIKMKAERTQKADFSMDLTLSAENDMKFMVSIHQFFQECPPNNSSHEAQE